MSQPLIAAEKAEGSLNVGTFFLGFFFGILGLAIVLLTFKDKEAWKSAIDGWAAVVVLYLIISLLKPLHW